MLKMLSWKCMNEASHNEEGGGVEEMPIPQEWLDAWNKRMDELEMEWRRNPTEERRAAIKEESQGLNIVLDFKFNRRAIEQRLSLETLSEEMKLSLMQAAELLRIIEKGGKEKKPLEGPEREVEWVDGAEPIDFELATLDDKKINKELKKIGKTLSRLEKLAIRKQPEEGLLKALRERKEELEREKERRAEGEEAREGLNEAILMADKLIDELSEKLGEDPKKMKESLGPFISKLLPDVLKIKGKDFDEFAKKALELVVDKLDDLPLRGDILKTVREFKNKNPEEFEQKKNEILSALLEKDPKKAEEILKKHLNEELTQNLLVLRDSIYGIRARWGGEIPEEEREELETRAGALGGKVKEALPILGLVGSFMLLALLLSVILMLSLAESLTTGKKKGGK